MDDQSTRNDADNEAVRPSWVAPAVIAALALVLIVMFVMVYRAQSHRSEALPQQVVTDLCRARDESRTDPAAALRTFNGTPHNALHNLAESLETRDPTAAERLNRAKARAEESLLAKEPDAAEILTTLVDQTVKGYRVLTPDGSLTACG